MNKSDIILESKQELQKKLEQLKAEEKYLIDFIKSQSSAVQENVDTLMKIKSKSKFLTKLKFVNEEINTALSKLFNLKVSILASNEDSSSESEDESIDSPTKVTCTESFAKTECSSAFPCEASNIKLDLDHPLNSSPIMPVFEAERLLNDLSIKETVIAPKKLLSNIFITEMQSPSLFWIQFDINCVEKIESRLQQHVKHLKETFEKPPEVETFCCAQSNIDNLWYRCKILKITKGTDGDFRADLFFIDNGKSEFRICSSKMKPLSSDLCNFPSQAIPCRLSGVVANKEWVDEEIEQFKNITFSQELNGVIVSEKEGDTYPIKLCNTDSSIDIFEELMKLISALQSDAKLKYPLKDSSPELVENSDCINPASTKIPFPKRLLHDEFHMFISKFHNVDEIFFHVVDNETSLQLDELWLKLNDWCENCLSQPRVDEIYLSSCWAVKYNVDNKWYRGRIIRVLPNQKYVFHLVDYGDYYTADLSVIKPLNSTLANYPSLVHQGSLYGIEEIVNKEQFKIFKDAIDLEKTLFAIAVSNSIDIVTETKYCLIIWDDKIKRSVCMNSALLAEGIATTTAIDLDKFTKQETVEKINTSNQKCDILDKWDPMYEDYNSELNTFGYNKDDAGVALTGYQATDNRVCHFFNNGFCYRNNCTFKHIKYEDANAIKLQEEFHTTIGSFFMTLPKKKALVGVKITACISPSHFFAIFPSGCTPLNVQDSDNAKTFMSNEDDPVLFHQELEKFYKKRQFIGNRGLFPALGSLVVVKVAETAEWYRAKIIEVYPEMKKARVFFVDYGDKSFMHFRDIHEIDSRFIHMPFQAVECFIPDITPAGDDWTEEASLYFKSLSKDKTLIALILDSNINNEIFIKLYDTTGDSDVDVGQKMVEMKYAIDLPETLQKFTSSSKDKEQSMLPG